jgi:hypothetical protein
VAFHGPQTIIAVLSQPGLPEGQLRWPLYISPTPVSYFSAVWLEPGALGFLAYERITGQDIRALVRSYHARGITTLILSYVEYGGCLYYPSRVPVRWLDYTGCAFNTRTYWYDCPGRPKAMDPARPGGERCPWVANFDLIEMILAEADAQGMQVMLGLGRSGDPMFSLALEDYYLAARDGIPNAIDPLLLNKRLGDMVSISLAVADELWAKYKHHPSLYGWALSHELTCYDVMRNYTDYLATTLKQRTLPDRPVLVAPYLARTCVQDAGTIPQHIRESGVDIYMYQDAVGSSAVTQRTQQRLRELSHEYADLARWHAGTGKHLWVTVEVWRASPTGDQRTSLSGDWSTEVATQVMEAAKVTSTLVLNEGFFYVENGVAALTIPGAAKRASAATLTQEYGRYALPFLRALQLER